MDSCGRRIAITGGIGTGKSTVARMFARLGAVILDADLVAREAVEPGSPCLAALRDHLGPEYFDETGRLLRGKLRDRIVSDSACRERVNAILHPFILSSMEAMWKGFRARDPHRPVLFDIPLLFEIHFESRFDTIVLVYVPPAVQIRRLMQRDGLTREQASRTLKMQMPIDSKKDKSHIIIDNSGSPEETWAQVRKIWKEWTGSEPAETNAPPF